MSCKIIFEFPFIMMLCKFHIPKVSLMLKLCRIFGIGYNVTNDVQSQMLFYLTNFVISRCCHINYFASSLYVANDKVGTIWRYSNGT